MANVIDLRESITGETDKKKQKTHIITLIISGSDKFYEDNNGVKKLEIEKKKKKTAQTWVTDGLFKEAMFET